MKHGKQLGFEMAGEQVAESAKKLSAQENHLLQCHSQVKKKTHNLDSTIPLASANLTVTSGNRFLSPNPPDIVKLARGKPIVGLYC